MSFIYTVLKDPQKKCLIETTQLFGVPKFTIIDVPTTSAKNLALKIKSAIVNQAYKWSLRKQFIVELEREKVNLKNNAQVELAIAVKFLIETEQIAIESFQKIVCVGSVNIHGKVFDCDVDTSISQEDELWIGSFKKSEPPLNHCDIKNLSDLNHLKIKKRAGLEQESIFFNGSLNFTESVIAHGQHNCIYFSNDTIKLKTSFKRINSYLNPVKFNRITHESSKDMNLVDSSGALDESLQRHSKGFLLMNDFVFSKESLTQNFLSYVDRNKTNFAIIYSLCPCGKAKLGKPKKCGLSLYRCRSKVEKLSVGTLSYFDLSFTDFKKESFVKPDALQKAKNIQCKREQKIPNSHCDFDHLFSTLSEEAKSLLYLPNDFGLKRQISILSVARTIADLKGREKVETSDIDKSMQLSFNGFKTLISTF